MWVFVFISAAMYVVAGGHWDCCFCVRSEWTMHKELMALEFARACKGRGRCGSDKEE